MSELAFDKEGNPFRFSRRTKKLRPRRWKNPGQRGTCAAVLNADGEQLLIDADAEYVEFRSAVGNVPGFYRLDQCDEDGAPIEDAPPAYVSIDSPRNAATSGEADPRDAVIRDLAQINAEVTRTIAERFASVMQAAADILRAADGAGLSRREPPPPPPAPISAPKNEDDDEDEDDDENEDDEEESESTAAAKLWTFIEPMMPAIKMWISAMVAKRSASLVTEPAPAPAPVPPAAAAPNPTSMPTGVAADQSAPAPAPAPAPPSVSAAQSSTAASAPAPSSTPPAVAHSPAAPLEVSAPTAAMTADASSAIEQTEAPRNVTSIEPTLEQWAHLLAIRARLSPRESAIAETVIHRMPLEMRAQWLAELSAFTPDQAADIVRSMIPKTSPKQPGNGNGKQHDGKGGPD